MYFIYTMLVAFFIGLWEKKSFKPLKDFTVELSFRGYWILLVTLAIHISIQLFYKLMPTLLANSLHVLSLFIVLIFLYLNRNLFKGTWFLLIGLFLNLLVIAVNKGRMPVSTVYMEWYGGEAKIESLMNGEIPFYTGLTKDSWFPYLADIIPMFHPSIAPALLSLGDVFLCIGIYLAVLGIFRKQK